MDIPNRLQLERSVTLALARASSRHRRELLGYLGDPPDIRRVPEDFWRRVEEDQRAVLLPFLAWIFASQAARHGLDSKASLAQGEAFAASRGRTVAGEYATNSRSRLEAIFDRLRGGGGEPPMTDEMRRAVLDEVFGPVRDEAVGVTEFTTASASGADWGAKRSGLASTADRWRTERDASVCPVCRPLDGTTREVWEPRFPDGPPAHPRCRCDILYDVTDLVDLPADFPEFPG